MAYSGQLATELNIDDKTSETWPSSLSRFCCKSELLARKLGFNWRKKEEMFIKLILHIIDSCSYSKWKYVTNKYTHTHAHMYTHTHMPQQKNYYIFQQQLLTLHTTFVPHKALWQPWPSRWVPWEWSGDTRWQSASWTDPSTSWTGYSLETTSTCSLQQGERYIIMYKHG